MTANTWKHFLRFTHTSADRGVAMTEFALAAIVLFMIVGGILDLANYLTRANVMQAAAHTAAAKAAWIPGFNRQEPADFSSAPAAGTPERAFYDAAMEIADDVESGVSSWVTIGHTDTGRIMGRTGVATPQRIRIVTYSPAGSAGAAAFRTSTDNITFSLPAVGGDGTRDANMRSQPIGARVNFRVRSIFGFTYNGSAVAWSYREPPQSAIQSSPVDCMGNPFNPRSLPTAGECCGASSDPASDPCCLGGAVVNDLNGTCVCPGGGVASFDPMTGRVRCDATGCTPAADGCAEDQKYDYTNCECLDEYCQYGETNQPRNPLIPWDGIRQVVNEDGTCGCPEVNGIPAGAECDPVTRCAPRPGTLIIECHNECLDNNRADQCPGGALGRIWLHNCNCGCESGAWYSDPNNPNAGCECVAPRVEVGGNCECPAGADFDMRCYGVGGVPHGDCTCHCQDDAPGVPRLINPYGGGSCPDCPDGTRPRQVGIEARCCPPCPAGARWIPNSCSCECDDDYARDSGASGLVCNPKHGSQEGN